MLPFIHLQAECLILCALRHRTFAEDYMRERNWAHPSLKSAEEDLDQCTQAIMGFDIVESLHTLDVSMQMASPCCEPSLHYLQAMSWTIQATQRLLRIANLHGSSHMFATSNMSMSLQDEVGRGNFSLCPSFAHRMKDSLCRAS